MTYPLEYMYHNPPESAQHEQHPMRADVLIENLLFGSQICFPKDMVAIWKLMKVRNKFNIHYEIKAQ